MVSTRQKVAAVAATGAVTVLLALVALSPNGSADELLAQVSKKCVDDVNPQLF